MTFLIDENLGLQLAAGMKGFGEAVKYLTDVLPAGIDDTEILAHIGDKGWFLITRDKKILSRPAELAALRNYKVGAFFMGGKNRSRCEIIQQLVRNWPEMKRQAGKTRRPFAFHVPPNGTKFKPIALNRMN